MGAYNFLPCNIKWSSADLPIHFMQACVCTVCLVHVAKLWYITCFTIWRAIEYPSLAWTACLMEICTYRSRCFGMSVSVATSPSGLLFGESIEQMLSNLIQPRTSWERQPSGQSGHFEMKKLCSRESPSGGINFEGHRTPLSHATIRYLPPFQWQIHPSKRAGSIFFSSPAPPRTEDLDSGFPNLLISHSLRPILARLAIMGSIWLLARHGYSGLRFHHHACKMPA
jgi:hypothetical protein